MPVSNVAITLLETSFYFVLLGDVERGEKLRAEGRKGCVLEDDRRFYDNMCRLFDKNPSAWLSTVFNDDLDEMLASVKLRQNKLKLEYLFDRI